MARRPASTPSPSALSALTATPKVVQSTSTVEIPGEIKEFIANAIAEAQSHSDYLTLPASAEAIDTAVRLGRIHADREGYKLLTRHYKRGETTALTYRLKSRAETDSDDTESEEE